MLDKTFQSTFNAQVNHLHLQKLGLYDKDSSILTTSFSGELSGQTMNSLSGSVEINNLFYQQEGKKLDLPSLGVNIVKRSKIGQVRPFIVLDGCPLGRKNRSEQILSCRSKQCTSIDSVLGSEKHKAKRK